jgi:hypothetical protein
MARRALLTAFALALAGGTLASADANIPPLSQWKAGPNAAPAIPPGQTIPIFPDFTPAADPQQPPKDRKDAGKQFRTGKPETLQPQSRLALVRYIHGEFARAVRPIPSVKKGHRIHVRPAADNKPQPGVAAAAVAANPGDTVQVTRLEFRAKEIVLDINGGSKQRKRWRDRIQITGGAGLPTVQTTTDRPVEGYQRAGATLIVDFGGPVPEMTPDEFKQFLSGYLDFTKQRSASVHWFETLPPEFQTAIKEKRAVVGMDREMVVAAMGRPEQKIRERDPDGLETEDWIYGHPPGKTIFVKFAGEKVIAVREFPR